MADDKFIQPLEGIEVTPGHGLQDTLLSPDFAQRAATRIAAGENREKVLTELAIEIVELEENLRADGIEVPELRVPEGVMRGLRGDDELLTLSSQEDLRKKYGIEQFEFPTATSTIRHIGFAPKSSKWYGWSHRAIFGFGVGSVVEEGDVISEGTAMDTRTSAFPVGYRAKTLDDAKKMAIKFALEVSEAHPSVLRAKEGALHAAADAHVPALSLAVRKAFSMARQALGKPPNVDAAIMAFKKSLQKDMPKLLLDIARDGGNAGLLMLKDSPRGLRAAKRGSRPKTVKLNFNFDAADPYAVEWADRHAAELIDGISETTREDINNAIADALEHGTIDEAYEEILAAVGDPERAQRIAHHEVMTAASEGQRLGWKQAVKNGLLTGDEQRSWITVGDQKVCPECESLDGTTADLDGKYPDPGGYGPPQHVTCRCTEGIA